MSLFLSGQKVEGHHVKVVGSLHLAGEDMSGSGSHTPQAEKGDKAMELGVSLSIPFAQSEWLRALVRLAQGKDGKGERTIYSINHRTAAALGIDRVVFQGALDAREDESLKQWNVTFNLVEYRSVPEKQAERTAAKKAKAVKAQAATGTTVSAAGSGSTPAASTAGGPGQPVTSTLMERVLQSVEDAL